MKLRAFILSALALVAFALAGCSTPAAGTVTIPIAPEWQAPSVDRLITAGEVAIEVRRCAPAAELRMADSAYTLVNYGWLQRYVEWTWHAARADGLRYTPESFDCEDFAVAFALFAGRAAGRAGVRCAPLVARVTVWQLHTVANVPGKAGTRHKVVAVATDRGVFIVEPQPDAGPFRIIPLAQYPNPITTVVLGDF